MVMTVVMVVNLCHVSTPESAVSIAHALPRNCSGGLHPRSTLFPSRRYWRMAPTISTPTSHQALLAEPGDRFDLDC